MAKINSKPSYNINDIKYGIDQRTFERALKIYEDQKISDVKETPFGFTATVEGTHFYHVEVDRQEYGRGDCDCYLGQNDVLCKHIIALALYAILEGADIPEDANKSVSEAVCSNTEGSLSKDELAETRNKITAAMKYIKSYHGPSRIWFQYQSSLSEGCRRLADIVNHLPVSLQTAKVLVNMLIRLDRKLLSGVDDSDGTVGGFIEDVVNVLIEYARIDPKCLQAFNKLVGISSSFLWEQPLIKLLDNASMEEGDGISTP